MKTISSFLHRVKEPVSVDDAVTYKQVTIRTNYNGVVLRGTKNGSEIGTKNQWRVSAGQFILSRIDARNGAFGIIPKELEGAIVTNDFLAYEIDQHEVDLEFFNIFLQSPVFLEACVKASRGNTNRKRVNEEFFNNYEVNLPHLDEQQVLIGKINRSQSTLNDAISEITRQQSLLAKLKQAILQEAIQGKLTADWRKANPDVEPASKLLQRIQAEKDQLIAEKKIRKEKPLPEIPPEEIPFEIPKGWEWCYLIDTSSQIHYGFTASADTSQTDIRLVRITDIQDGQVDWPSVPGCLCSENELDKYRLCDGDLLIARTGGTVGKSYLVNSLSAVAVFASYLVRVVPASPDLAQYIYLFFGSPCYWGQITDVARGDQPNVSGSKLKRLILPLPPFAEQAAIVERVEALMSTCSELETEIEHSRNNADNLLQAVLKEAFTA